MGVTLDIMGSCYSCHSASGHYYTNTCSLVDIQFLTWELYIKRCLMCPATYWWTQRTMFCSHPRSRRCATWNSRHLVAFSLIDKTCNISFLLLNWYWNNPSINDFPSYILTSAGIVQPSLIVSRHPRKNTFSKARYIIVLLKTYHHIWLLAHSMSH